MAENRIPFEPVKIRVPSITDDPILGRFLTSIPNIFSYTGQDYIIIKENKMSYNTSFMSGDRNKSFALTNIAKFLLDRKEVTCFDRVGKWDIWGRLGTEIELSLVDTEGKRHILIKRFMIYKSSPFRVISNAGQKDWDRFLSELCTYSGLPLEEMNEPNHEDSLEKHPPYER